MEIEFDFPRKKAITAVRLARVPDLFHHRAALFFTPTANVPAQHVGNGGLDVTIPWVLPNSTTYANNYAYRMPRLWVDALQRATGKIRWQPNFPAKVTIYAYDDMTFFDMSIGGKALVDALKVKTYGRKDGKQLHYFGAIQDDSPNHIDFEGIIDLKDPSRSGSTRIVVDPILALQRDGRRQRLP